MSAFRNPMFMKSIEAAAVFACGITAGSTFYVTFMESPGRLSKDLSYQLENWHVTFPRAAGFLKPFGMSVNALIGACIYGTGKKSWWVSFGFLFAMGPVTVLLITPTNNTLLALKEKSEADERKAGPLIKAWANLHNIRTLISCIGFAASIYSISETK